MKDNCNHFICAPVRKIGYPINYFYVEKITPHSQLIYLSN
jgi:hypothetical protein